ncbi:uncharacterized protein LOC111373286 isoform X4 [Olea europaea var. sylvestris]|uniref:uncharacterized protein LOC111373286 isoform X4 n=1 Tax=Olea europaea var. sylvestris TaxID=158386 RepID=UPI000C1D6D99|nr:uncharacterized protein LOC111373286 isoform X4 [Olea europaea var. sylvestris]
MAKGNQLDFQLPLPKFPAPTDQICSGKSQSPPLAHRIPFFMSYQGVSEELEGHHLPGHAASMDLNMHPSTSGNSCTISSDALLKIQVYDARVLILPMRVDRHTVALKYSHASFCCLFISSKSDFAISFKLLAEIHVNLLLNVSMFS